MNLSERIKLIDDMIRENPGSSIKDYCRICKHLEGRKEKNPVLADVRFFVRLEDEARDLMRLHSLRHPVVIKTINSR